MSDFSSQAVIDFLTYAASKGLLNKATATAKRIAVERVFAAAEPDEAADVRTVNIENLMHRFVNLNGSDFKPESLTSYQSRTRSGIEDFLSWKANPMGFRPSRRGASKPKTKVKGDQVGMKTTVDGGGSVSIDLPPHVHTLPIPIRNNLTVQVQGVPFDLTKSEASKIANVILAMATEV